MNRFMAADIIDYEIIGDDMQVVVVELDPGEGVRAEAGTMMFMDQDIEMQTGTEGGLFKGFKRMLTGESFSSPRFCIMVWGKRALRLVHPIRVKSYPWSSVHWGARFYARKTRFFVLPGV